MLNLVRLRECGCNEKNSSAEFEAHGKVFQMEGMCIPLCWLTDNYMVFRIMHKRWFLLIHDLEHDSFPGHRQAVLDEVGFYEIRS